MADSFPLKVDLGPENGQLNFESVEDIEHWRAAEKAAWKWLYDLKDPEFARARDAQTSILTKTSELIAQHRSNNLNEVQFASQLRSFLVRHCNEKGAAISTGPRAQFVLGLREEDPKLAAYALQFNQGKPEFPNALSFIAATRIALYQQAMTGSAKAERAAFREIKKQVESVQAHTSSLLADLRTQKSNFESEAADLKRSETDAVARLITECQSKWNQLESYFREELALQAPTWYWREKSATHRRNATRMALLTVAVSVASAMSVYLLADWLLLGIKDLTIASLFPVAVFIAGMTFAIWPIRVVLRIFLSQLHLATESVERRVMTLTYLTLQKKEAVTNVDRQIILQAIFRASSDGMIRDDAAPITLVEAITRYLDRSK
jgi:hypothetical protein